MGGRVAGFSHCDCCFCFLCWSALHLNSSLYLYFRQRYVYLCMRDAKDLEFSSSMFIVPKSPQKQVARVKHRVQISKLEYYFCSASSRDSPGL